MILTQKEWKSKIVEWLREQWGVRETNGNFYIDIYADYRDEIGRGDLQRLANSASPYEEFLDWISEAYENALDEEWGNLVSKCAEELEIKPETAWGWLSDMVCIRPPEKHFLNQEIHVDILVDTGDGDYDLTCNNIAPAWGGCDPEEANYEASLFWLASQQGFCAEQVVAALKGAHTESLFLKSIVQEVENESSSINVLTFLCTMTLEQWIEIRESGAHGSLRIEKGAMCGLYDPWSGSGSVLEIELEHDVVLPMKLVHEVTPDVCLYKYGVDEV
jgi:hypothetical protein